MLKIRFQKSPDLARILKILKITLPRYPQKGNYKVLEDTFDGHTFDSKNMKTMRKREERICPGCEITFTPEKSNKQAYCCPACKDKSNSKKREHRDQLMNKQLEKYRENYKTLRLFEKYNSVIVTDKELTNLNFDFDYLPAANYDKDELYFPFGYISMYITKQPFIYLLKFNK